MKKQSFPKPTSPPRLPVGAPRLLTSRARAHRGTSCAAALLALIAVSLNHALAQTNLLDNSFEVGTGVTGQIGSYGQFVHALALDNAGRVVLAGNFTQVQGAPRSCVARVLPEGTLDTSFNPGTGANQEILAVATQPDGKVLLGGAFTRFNATNCARLVRLNNDGSLDAGFALTNGANDFVRALALQPDGRIVLAGQFTRVGTTPRSGVARLEPDGHLDTSFDPGTGVGGTRFVDAVCVLPDGKIVIAGDFNSYNGTPRASIARLHSDGSLDTSFDPGTGVKPDDPILSVAPQADGKLVVAGCFTALCQRPWKSIGRLLSDGRPDPDFNPGSGLNGGFSLAQVVALDAGGNILIGGWFDRVGNCSRPFLARLFPSGQVDTNWNARVDAQVRALVIQPDGKAVLGGNFTSVSGGKRARLARIHPGRIVEGTFAPCRQIDGQRVEFEFRGSIDQHYQIETSTDLQVWTPCATVQGGQPFAWTDPVDTNQPQRFYRTRRLP